MVELKFYAANITVFYETKKFIPIKIAKLKNFFSGNKK